MIIKLNIDRETIANDPSVNTFIVIEYCQDYVWFEKKCQCKGPNFVIPMLALINCY